MKITKHVYRNVWVGNDKLKCYPVFQVEDNPTEWVGEVVLEWCEYLAVKDLSGYITISAYCGYLYTVGNCGTDFCFRVEDIPAICVKLGIEIPR